MTLPLTAALQELMELGVEGPALIAAMRRLEEATYTKPMATMQEAVAEATRIADERKAKDRARKSKPSTEIQGIPRRSEEIQAEPEPLPARAPTCAGKSLPSSSLRSEAYPPERPTVSTPKGSKSLRGERLPESWRPDADGWTYAVQLLDGEPAAQAQLERFRDYWRAVAGAKGRKLDWPATWRNWCRTASENAARKAPHERPHPDAKHAARQANLATFERGADLAARLHRES